jgi:hypothetical protein
VKWFESIDNYCERLDESFWAEPLNALSNVSFLAAASLLFLHWRRSGQGLAGLVLVVNVMVIGIGSFLFHTFANRWSSLADVLPITVFINLYLALAVKSYLQFRWWSATLLTLAFLLASPLVGEVLRPLVGSSAFYVPALIAIFAVAAAARHKSANLSNSLIAAGVIFCVSIYYRAVDLPICDLHTQGTHARWHLLNGVVLFVLVRTYLVFTARPSAR